MTKTIEAARADLECIFKDLYTVACDIDAVDLAQDIEQTRLNIVIDLAPFLCEYYIHARVGYSDFAREIVSIGADQKIIILGKRIADALSIYPKSKFTPKKLYEYNQYVNRAREFTIVVKDVVPYDRCEECGRMMSKPDMTYLVCECGLTKVALDIPSKEDSNNRDDTVKRAKANYTYGRHYEYWSQRIQGIEIREIPVVYLKKIQYVLLRDKYTTINLNCEIMRTVLKDPAVKLTTELNEHASYLVGKFGGAKPYVLTADESHKAKEMFMTIMYYYEKQHPNAGNKPYYPYFIYKIYEHMFARDRIKSCILKFIHLQSVETVRKHDKDLEEICKEAGKTLEMIYRPTDRNRRV